jgi:hypothetical protein
MRPFESGWCFVHYRASVGLAGQLTYILAMCYFSATQEGIFGNDSFVFPYFLVAIDSISRIFVSLLLFPSDDIYTFFCREEKVVSLSFAIFIIMLSRSGSVANWTNIFFWGKALLLLVNNESA